MALVPIKDLVTKGRVKPISPDETVWHLNLDQIESGTGRTLTRLRLPAGKAGNSTQPFEKGTVLYSKLRPYLNKVVLADERGLATTELVPLRVREDAVIPEYLAQYLRSDMFLSEASERVTGAKMPRLILDWFWNHEVPLPPLEEQRRIACLLDEVDRLQRLRTEANEKAQRVLPALFADMFGDRDANPKGWQTATLAQVLDGIQTGWSPNCVDEPVGADEWGVLKLGAVSWDWFDETANKRLPKGVDARPELAVSVGDILMSRKNTRELVGASVFIDQVQARLMFPDLMFRLKPSEAVDPCYLWGAVQTPSVREQIRQRASGSAASMCNVSQGRLREVSVVLPPMDAQKSFAGVAARLFASRRQSEDATRRLAAACRVLQSRLFAQID